VHREGDFGWPLAGAVKVKWFVYGGRSDPKKKGGQGKGEGSKRRSVVEDGRIKDR